MHDTLHELIDKKWMVSALDDDDADDAMVFKRSDTPLGEWLVICCLSNIPFDILHL